MNKYIIKCLMILSRALRINLSDEITDSIVQFVKFGIVGVTNTLISYLLNVGTLKLIEGYNLAWDYVAGNLVAFILSVLWSFYWNNKYVFSEKPGEKRNIGSTLLKTYVSYGFTGIILTNILSYIWIDCLGISKYIAPIINLIVSVPLNFIINKKWAFKS